MFLNISGGNSLLEEGHIFQSPYEISLLNKNYISGKPRDFYKISLHNLSKNAKFLNIREVYSHSSFYSLFFES